MERVRVFFVVAFLSLISDATLAEEEQPLNSAELENGFEVMFNGRDLRNWSNQGNWTVLDGAVTCIAPGGNLVCERPVIFDPFFELRFEWKVIKGGNSLAKKASFSGPADGGFYTEFRVTTLSESGSHGSIVRQLGYMAHFYATAGGAVGLFGPEKVLSPDAPIGLSTSSGPTKLTSRPIGQWNSSRIVWRGETFQHWLNGEKVTDFNFRPLEAEPPVVKTILARLENASSQALKDGMRVQLEVVDSPLMYRGIMLRRLRADAVRDE